MSQSSKTLEFMVETLNKLLNKKLEIVDFDELTNDPQKILGLFNELLVWLEAPVTFNPKDDSSANIQALYKFLTQIVQYRKLQQESVEDFGKLLMQGDKNMILGVMHWILKTAPHLKTRVYLSRFLMPISVPPELLTYDNLRAAVEDHKRLRNEFRDSHKDLTTLREKVSSPQEIKNALFKMSQDKEHLKAKISEQKKKVADLHTEWKDLVASTSKLRHQMDEKDKLMKSGESQRIELQKHETKLQEMMQRLKDTEKQLGSHDIDALVKKLDLDVKHKTDLLKNRLPAEIEEYKSQIDAMKTLSNTPVNVAYTELEKSIRKTLEAISTKEQEYKEILEKREQKSDKTSEIARRQNMLLRTERSKVDDRLSALEKENASLTRQLQEKTAEANQYAGQTIPSQEEFEKRKNELRKKVNRTKSMRGDLDLLKSEIIVLKSTQQELIKRHPSAKDFYERLQQNQEESGYRNVKDKIEELSKNKSKVDKEKTQTLEEISRVVKETTQQIEAKKAELGPMVQKVRKVRQEFQKVEATYSEKKAFYESNKVGFEGERSKLNDEILLLKGEIEQHESLYHEFNCRIHIDEVMKARVEREKKFLLGNERLNKQYGTYQDFYKGVLKLLESQNKDLQSEERYIRDNHESNLQQIDNFQQLQRLLECKMQCIKNPEIDQYQTNSEYDIMKTTGKDDQLLILN